MQEGWGVGGEVSSSENMRRKRDKRGGNKEEEGESTPSRENRSNVRALRIVHTPDGWSGVCV